MNIEREIKVRDAIKYCIENFDSQTATNRIVEFWKDELKLQEQQCNIANVVKSLPNDEEVKAHIDTLPYYGTCTTEYNEGFEDGVKWLKEQLAK